MPGRKRGLATDVLCLVIAVVVAAASIHDNAIGNALLDRVAAATPPGSVQTALADQGFKSSVFAHGARHGIAVQIVGRNPAEAGFVPQPKRWVVEQTYGTMSLHRRLGARLRTRSGQLRVTRVLGDDGCDDPPAGRPFHSCLARHVSTPDPGTWLLDRIEAREKALTSQIEQLQARIEE